MLVVDIDHVYIKYATYVLWEEYTTVLKYLLRQPTPRKVHGVNMAFGRVQMPLEQNPPDYPNKRTHHESGHHH